MKIYNYISKLFVVAAIFSMSSCETIDLDQTENPSTLNQSYLNPTYSFNYVQLTLPDFVNSAHAFTPRVTRQMAMTGGNTYDNAFAPVNFDTNWSQGYRILNAVKLMEPKAREQHKLYALGASKVIRCYVLMTLVDLYGDIPYSEALLGNENVNPKYDSSASVYKGILGELDDAIAVLNDPADKLDPSMDDLYYTNKLSWITLANTLKIKLYNNARQAGADIGVPSIGVAIAAVVSGGNYIDQETEDFAFKYGNSRNLPNARHPLYNDQYELGGGAYIANYMAWAMSTEKGYPALGSDLVTQADPRLYFYFYKQETDPQKYKNDTFTLPGRARPAHYNELEFASFYDQSILTPYVVSNWVNNPTGMPKFGFWGRDHGDNSGIPPDADLRTVAGVYPIGGKFGTDGHTVQNSGTDGALGQGIMPMVLSSYVHFMLAEASLTATDFINAGRARIEFEAGITQSIKKVTEFDLDYTKRFVAGDETVMKESQKTTITASTTFYISDMLAKYDAAIGDQGKLQVIIKEFFIAAWGNGIEPYNNYRRTGFPDNFQPTVLQSSSSYYYTAFYPAIAVNNNPNIPTNVRTRKVFWDKANITLH
jgi:hypothetical protein